MARFCLLSYGLVLFSTMQVIAGGDQSTRKVPKELLEKRLEAAQKVYKQNLLRHRNREGLPAELFGWSERWLEAELALCGKAADRVKAFRAHLDRTREVEGITASYAKTGQGRQADAEAATYYRLEAEIRLHMEGVEPHPAKGPKAKADSDKVQDRKPAQQQQGAPSKVEADIKELLKGSWAKSFDDTHRSILWL